MEPKDKQLIDTMQADIRRLSRLVYIMDRRIKQLEKDNVRIKHDARGIKMNIAARQS